MADTNMEVYSKRNNSGVNSAFVFMLRLEATEPKQSILANVLNK
jgi:hypothetical protein